MAAGLAPALACILDERFIPLLIVYDVFLCCLLLLDFLTIPGAGALRAERDCPDVVSHGLPLRITLRFFNYSRHPLRVEFNDSPPSSFESETCRGSAVIPAGEAIDVRYEAAPSERGDYEFGDLFCRLYGRLGMAVRSRRLSLSARVSVYPDLAAISRRDYLRAPSVCLRSGTRRLRAMGEGFEFERLRDLVPGDDSRLIDWKSTAKRRKLTCRQYEMERGQNVMIALDCGRLMRQRAGRFSKLDWAVNAALYLAYVAAMKDDHVGLAVFDEEIRALLPPTKGRRQLPQISRCLYRAAASRLESDYSTAFSAISRCLQRRSLIVLFTDIVEPDVSRNLLDHMRMLAPRHLPLCIAMEDENVTGILDRYPEAVDHVYEKAVAVELRRDTAKAIAILERGGGIALTAPPGALSLAAAEKYLSIKARGAL